ncbi:hypothetical protein V5O48_007220 [Marasmius crinis-equi]|uniref:Uncharacterized protein n=1 Tax=Marasmius crinis-equi TaxID=585013 RepID=A0ABR3FHA2_9AGAR
MLFVGLACGSWLGGMILKTRRNPSPYILFFVSVTLLVLLLIFIALACPESNEKVLSGAASREGARERRGASSVFRRSLKEIVIGLVSPISMFIPRKSGDSPRKDWNITLVGAALFLYLISIGVYPLKYLYGKHVYSWDTGELGFFMSLLWVSRAFNLLVLLPILISYFKPKPKNGEPVSIQSELRFDKILASVSLAVDGIADALVAIVPSSAQPAFVAFSCLSSFTSGGNPTLHSLGAVCLHAGGYSSEVGSLFGAMAVLSAIAHVISPTLYATTYGLTVANFPKAIFVLATVLLGLAVFLLSLVRTNRGTNLPSRHPE